MVWYTWDFIGSTIICIHLPSYRRWYFCHQADQFFCFCFFVLYFSLTAISHRCLRNDFFFPLIYFPYSIWTFISLFYLDFYLPFIFGILIFFRSLDLLSIFFRPFQSQSEYGFLPNFFQRRYYTVSWRSLVKGVMPIPYATCVPNSLAGVIISPRPLYYDFCWSPWIFIQINFQVAGARDRNDDTWVTSPTVPPPYTTGDSPGRSSYFELIKIGVCPYLKGEIKARWLQSYKSATAKSDNS